MTLAIWLLPTAVLLVGVAQDDKEAARKEHVQFEGVWRFARVEVEGVKQPDVPFETNKIIIRGDSSYVVVQGKRITRGQFKVDPTKSPKHFDVTITDGPAKGRTYSAIYELNGDTYKFCGSLRSADRPTALSSEPGSGTMLQVLKREKQTVKEAFTELGRRDLTGNWQTVLSVVDGKTATDEGVKQIKLSIDAEGNTSMLREEKPFMAATTKIDPTTHPMTIDFTWTDGERKGQTALGIYKLEDDRLTICDAEPANGRPKDFSSKPGSGHRLMSYERVKSLDPQEKR